MSDRVDLMTAWTWDCPKCGKRNHTNGCQSWDLSEEQCEILGIEIGDYAVTAPENVTCEKCFESFDTNLEDEHE